MKLELRSCFMYRGSRKKCGVKIKIIDLINNCGNLNWDHQRSGDCQLVTMTANQKNNGA